MTKKSMFPIELIFLILLTAVELFLLIDFSSQKTASQEFLASRVMRLHILANSDSQKDQQIKCKVRDSMTTALAKASSDFHSQKDVQNYFKSQANVLTRNINKILEKEGVSYRSECQLIRCHFPDRKYGNLYFPAGDYQAVQIRLGNASGHNWWCVLYPPLCFLESASSAQDSVQKCQAQETFHFRFRYLTFLNSFLRE